MTPLFVIAGVSSIRKYVVIALTTVVVLFSLPIIALFSITNVAALGGNSSGTSGSSYSGTFIYTDPSAPGDLYDYGNCTYWVSLRRAQINEPIPQHWGDAHYWDDNAILDGYIVDHTPSYGAIFQTDAGALGHVAFVEKVDPATGAWTISEMNAVGFDEVDQRTFPAAAAFNYNFIHGRFTDALQL